MIIPKYNEPRVAGIVRFERSVYTSGSGTCGSSERVGDVIISIDEGVHAGSNKGCIDGRVGRRDVTEEEISVLMEESMCESLCQVVRDIEFVLMRSSSIKSLSTHLQIEKYLISKCLVQVVGF
jgi:hypothetical protein